MNILIYSVSKKESVFKPYLKDLASSYPSFCIFLKISISPIIYQGISNLSPLGITVEVLKRQCYKHGYFGFAVITWSSNFNTFLKVI